MYTVFEACRFSAQLDRYLFSSETQLKSAVEEISKVEVVTVECENERIVVDRLEERRQKLCFAIEEFNLEIVTPKPSVADRVRPPQHQCPTEVVRGVDARTYHSILGFSRVGDPCLDR